MIIAGTLAPEHRAAAAALLMTAGMLVALFAAVDGRSAVPLLLRFLLGLQALRLGLADSLLNTLTTRPAITLAALYLQNTWAGTP